MDTMTAELTRTQREFRAAMANLSAGVSVVTTDGDRGRAGTTVSAVCSVTDMPPTMVVCVNRSATSHDAFCSNDWIAINVLAHDQEDVALVFANATDVPREKRFDDPRWDLDSFGAPVLKGTAASLVGKVSLVTEHGSHSVLFVEVDAVLTTEADATGLVYFRRRFHGIAPTADE